MARGTTRRGAAGRAALDVAKRRSEIDINEPQRLSSGYWVMVRPVSPSLMADVQAGIADPEIPEFYDEDKGRTEQNPNDPRYLKGLEEAQAMRILATFDVLYILGLDLVDPETKEVIDAPPVETWLPKLRLLERINRGKSKIDLESYDFDDPMERKFVFLKYIAVASPSDMAMVTKAAGFTEEDVQAAEATFRDNEARGAD